MALAGICGGDPRRIEATITWRDWIDFNEEWAENPPAHLLLAMKWLKPRSKKTRQDQPIEQPITQDWDWDLLGPAGNA